MSKKEFLAQGATEEDVELVQWFVDRGCQLVKYGAKESDGWIK